MKEIWEYCVDLSWITGSVRQHYEIGDHRFFRQWERCLAHSINFEGQSGEMQLKLSCCCPKSGIFWVALHTVINISFIPLACAECDDSLLFSWASSIPVCYVLFPATFLHQLFFHSLSSCHLFLGLRLNLIVSKFIYNMLLGILFSSILCTCPNQCNLFNLIVSIIVGFLTLE